ncbi:hypothetical protein AB6A40_010556 [Gnathostoma spinigerum]|uniref:Uncharacterized protein n=1 Tax=Gnathostoma spinigerum TaxID=75299 RepID=A0ABD6EXM1_9BILA
MDLHSGKLHKDFHDTLDQKVAELQKLAAEQPDIFGDDENDGGSNSSIDMGARETTPPVSVFKELKPSESRYSLLRKTEL